MNSEEIADEISRLSPEISAQLDASGIETSLMLYTLQDDNESEPEKVLAIHAKDISDATAINFCFTFLDDALPIFAEGGAENLAMITALIAKLSMKAEQILKDNGAH